ncbi:MAG: diguanylate cyclase, partial [Spirochaetia bacterium]|nr:diguanylate cyclase [Spirochaetia bacterium]
MVISAPPPSRGGKIVLVGPDDDEAACELIKGSASRCLPRTAHPALLLREVRHSFEYQQLRHEISELHAMNTLLQTSQDLSCCLDPAEVLQLIAHALIREIGAARAIGFVKDGEQFSALADQCGDSYVTPLLTEQIGLLLQQHILHSPRVVRLVLPPELHGSTVLDLREALVIPLLSHGAVLGCVVLFNDAGQLLPPIQNDRPIVFLQEQGARALENAFRFTATRDLLFVDELTGLFNYRYLKTALEREIKRADRYATQLTVMFLDLDNFKIEYCHLFATVLTRHVLVLGFGKASGELAVSLEAILGDRIEDGFVVTKAVGRN